MVQYDDQANSTQCVVYDKHPGSEQKKINIVVRPTYSVGQVISDITTQYRYDSFELVLQPSISGKNLVYLNDRLTDCIYKVPGFDPLIKNTLVLLPAGEWDGNTKKRYELSMPSPLKSIGSAQRQNIVTITSSSNSSSSSNNNNNNHHNSKSSSKSNHSINNNNHHIANSSHNINNNDMKVVIATSTMNSDTKTTTTTNTMATTVACSAAVAVAAASSIAPAPAITADSLNLSPMSDPDQLSDDDLALGASASPTETEPMNGAAGLPLPLTHLSPDSKKPCTKVQLDMYYNLIADTKSSLPTTSSSPPPPALASTLSLTAPTAVTATTSAGNGYVGLVNQAMTCYLNSLLQALYMTPEFRNALYRWESDNDNEAKNIPYQLQKLFLNLQTSKKSAVETTDLTRSFGWDSTEAWQQHDIQELCRVMFDALEHKFKNTKQANLISNLYEGKMIDYVKCLECNTEKTRADTFLDIPLPVRPFGSTVAYGSIEEALRAFVQPETLDGNNQYFCEKCNKKCDAHKGLKFKNFPYVLTLHLKRFDFDYSTMHRIKLNDKVTFPQTLNLNTFVNATDAQTFTNLPQQVANGAPSAGAVAAALNGVAAATTTTDDCSTTDSGSAMEEDNCSSGIATTTSSQHENDMNDDDEGIDMSTSTDHRIGGGNNAEQRLKHESGPFIYELFAIMIHSGSASGGHYYAYIRELENNEWFCFNDMSVSPITQEDIQKSFGGGTTKAYYSSVYSSSTNAYMLMYRQIDPKRNEHSIKALDFPEHINALLPKLHTEEESRPSRSVRQHSAVSDLGLPDLIKPRVYFYNPQLKKLKMTRVYVSRSFDVNSVLESAYQLHNVEDFAPLSRCRLVGYDQTAEEILQSFEGVNDPSLADIRASCDGTLDFLLEYRTDGQEFEVYKPGGATWNVFMVNLGTMEMDGPYFVHSSSHQCNDVLRHSIAVRLHVKESEMLLATLVGSTNRAFVAYDPAPTKEANAHLQVVARTHFKNLTYFFMNVPNTEPTSLEVIGIPAYEAQTPTIEVSADVVDAVLMNGIAHSSTASIGDSIFNGHSSSSGSSLSANDYARRESPLPPCSASASASSTPAAMTTGHESNSEDSSLSDGDRTLVESVQNRGGGDSQISSSSHSPQLSSPEDESNNESLNRIHAFFNGTDAQQHAAEQDAIGVSHNNATQFFHAIKIGIADSSSSATAATEEDAARKPAIAYKILVDSRMKMGAFKRHIETLIRVPANYFKIQRKHDALDPINPAQSLVYINDGETLLVELGKVLQADEHKAKIFFMRLSELDNETGKLPCVCEWVYNAQTTVAKAKKELVAKLRRIDAKYQTLTLENCRLWVKGGRNPIKILNDEESLGDDLRSPVDTEYLLQQCDENVKPQVSEDSLTIFVRRWHPDQLYLDGFQEITLEKDSEIRSVLAKITDIPEERIAYCKINSSFPCTSISMLSVNGSMSWFSISATLDKYPLTTTLNGNVYFYKDVSKAPKELSTEERRMFSIKEKIRLDNLGCISTSFYSPRRERALKIYLDSPQATSSTSTSATAPMDVSGGAKMQD